MSRLTCVAWFCQFSCTSGSAKHLLRQHHISFQDCSSLLSQEDVPCTNALWGYIRRRQQCPGSWSKLCGMQWAEQGVLLLNVCLTVRSHQANSHAKQGWEPFTDAAISALNRKKRNVVFLLWGKSAELKAKGVDRARHHVLTAAHPSGLSANRVRFQNDLVPFGLLRACSHSF